MDSCSLSAVWGSVPGTSPRLTEPAASGRRGALHLHPALQKSWGVVDNIRIFSWNWFLVSSSDLIYELDWTWTKFTCVSKEYLKIPFHSSYAERWTEQLWVRCIPSITDCFHLWPPGSRLSRGLAAGRLWPPACCLNSNKILALPGWFSVLLPAMEWLWGPLGSELQARDWFFVFWEGDEHWWEEIKQVVDYFRCFFSVRGGEIFWKLGL